MAYWASGTYQENGQVEKWKGEFGEACTSGNPEVDALHARLYGASGPEMDGEGVFLGYVF